MIGITVGRWPHSEDNRAYTIRMRWNRFSGIEFRDIPREVVREAATRMHFFMLNRRYPAAAPDPTRRISFEPHRLTYGMSSSDRPGTLVKRGVVGGEWDAKKAGFWETPLRAGLRERFEEGLEWEDTQYWTSAVDRIRSGEPVKRLDRNDPSIKSFRRYLAEIDELYRDMTMNGFDPTSPILVNIGREGELILDHGNHRASVAKLAQVSRVWATVRYRHAGWQATRERLAACPEATHNHPDLAEFAGE